MNVDQLINMSTSQLGDHAVETYDDHHSKLE